MLQFLRFPQRQTVQALMPSGGVSIPKPGYFVTWIMPRFCIENYIVEYRDGFCEEKKELLSGVSCIRTFRKVSIMASEQQNDGKNSIDCNNKRMNSNKQCE